jgi:CheY-like chemotaxis protein
VTAATVLVVDDDDDIREAMAFVLRSSGFQVAEAMHGRQALDWILLNGLPQVILLDVNMPVMNGAELVRELRARGLTACPILVVTAACDARRSAEELGAAGFIGKPFELDELVGTARLHINSGRRDNQ